MWGQTNNCEFALPVCGLNLFAVFPSFLLLDLYLSNSTRPLPPISPFATRRSIQLNLENKIKINSDCAKFYFNRSFEPVTYIKFYKNYVDIWILVDSPTVLISLGGLLRSRLAWKIDKYFFGRKRRKKFWNLLGHNWGTVAQVWKNLKVKKL